MLYVLLDLELPCADTTLYPDLIALSTVGYILVVCINIYHVLPLVYHLDSNGIILI